jgi:ketosteroid isomerase-like protein
MSESEYNEVERNKALARQFFDALTASDVPAIVAAYADDGYVETMGQTLISGRSGKAQIQQAAGQVLGAFPQGIRFVIHEMTAEGDRVAVEAESFAIHASGKPYNNKYHFLMRFRDGKLLQFKEYMDTEMVTEVLCGGQRPAKG